MHIRQENPSDYPAVFQLVERAFLQAEHTDHQEQFLVERLRRSDAYIPELALVATSNEQIVGYILLTKIQILAENGSTTPSLAMAPVAVLPEFQGKGIGGLLIEEAHKIARKLNYSSIILLGHKDYYPRFGYQQMKPFGISLPFDVPDENCKLIELQTNALKGVTGFVQYASAFFE